MPDDTLLGRLAAKQKALVLQETSAAMSAQDMPGRGVLACLMLDGPHLMNMATGSWSQWVRTRVWVDDGSLATSIALMTIS